MRHFFAICGLFFLLLFAQPGAARAQENVVVHIGNHVAQMNDWSLVPVELQIPTGTIVGAVTAQLSYDPALFRLDACTSDLAVAQCHDDNAGHITFAIVAPAGLSDSLTILQLRFTSLQDSGQSPLILTIEQVADVESNALPFGAENGLLCIRSCENIQPRWVFNIQQTVFLLLPFLALGGAYLYWRRMQRNSH